MKRLPAVQQRILTEITWDARASVEDVARRLNLRGHTVRHAIQSLQKSLDLSPLCWTHPYLRGQAPYRVFFSVNPSGSKRVKALVARLKSLSQVSWMASLIGRYQFVLGLRAKGLSGVTDLFAQIDEEFEGVILERNISAILKLSQFVPWLAHVGSGGRNAWQYSVTETRANIDAVDEAVLVELQRRPLVSMKDLGKACGLPPSTVSYRTERMLQSGVIIGFAFGYDERILGREALVLSVSTGGLGGHCFDALFDLARRHPQVSWIAQTLGEWDVEFGVVLDEVQDLHGILHEIHSVGRVNVQGVSSHAIIHTLKD